MGDFMENTASAAFAPSKEIVTVKHSRRHSRPRDYLTEKEIEKLINAAGANRWGHRDAPQPSCLSPRIALQPPPGTYVFVSERLAPLSVAGYQRMVARAGKAAGFPFDVHSHMLRHACGYKLANDGQDTRAIQHYLGHKSINSTVRYTALAPDRFKNFWKD